MMVRVGGLVKRVLLSRSNSMKDDPVGIRQASVLEILYSLMKYLQIFGERTRGRTQVRLGIS